MQTDGLYPEKKNYAKFIIIGSALVFVIAAIVLALFLQGNRTKPHIYIALGDSVSSGYGLTGYGAAPEGLHSELFFEMLKNDGYVDEYHNMAASGYTTAMLLESLSALDADELKLFRDARVITVNIGGNNILAPFLEYLSEMQVLSGLGSIRAGTETLMGAWGVIYEIVSGAESIAGFFGEARNNLGGILAGVGGTISGIGELMTGVGEIISGTPNAASTWRGAFSPELEAMLEEGVQTFSDEFIEIITWLEKNAPNATIIVNTIYNPIPQEILRISVPISNWATVLLDSINDTIISESLTSGFLVTDIHSYFSDQSELTSMNLNPFAGQLSLDMIHPNAEGHILIAELNYATFSTYQSTLGQ